jgi:hypothetical protein
VDCKLHTTEIPENIAKVITVQPLIPGWVRSNNIYWQVIFIDYNVLSLIITKWIKSGNTPTLKYNFLYKTKTKLDYKS